MCNDDWVVRPDQVVDFQSLVGDSVDNVPGVPKVGPKTARTLLETFGTLDHVLANADRVQGKKLQENLIAFADQARMSRELVRLRTDLPLEIDFEAARVQTPDRPKLHEFFNLLGFRRFSAAMTDEAPGEGQPFADTNFLTDSSGGNVSVVAAPSSVVVPEEPVRTRQQSLFE